VEIAGWRSVVEADSAETRRRVARDLEARDALRLPADGPRLGVSVPPGRLPRLRLVKGGAPAELWQALLGSADESNARLYTDSRFSAEPMLEFTGDEVVVLQPRFWPIYLHSALLGLMSRQTSNVGLHAGVVGLEDGALLLAGRSGAGKSTTLWAMHLQGADVYSDELAIFRLPDYELHAWRTGVGLRPEGLRLNGEQPAFKPWQEWKPGDPKYRPALRSPRRPCPPAAGRLVFLEGFGERPVLRPMAGGEATGRTIEVLQCGDPNLPLRLDRAAEIVSRIPCYGLICGAPAATADLLLHHWGGLV